MNAEQAPPDLVLAVGPDRFEVEVPGPDVDGPLRHLWARCLAPGQPPADVAGGGGTDVNAASGRPVLFESEIGVSRVTNEVIGARRGRSLMFHAAGLADTTSGRSVALVAPSGMGKTTAAAALCDEFGYLTDEALVVDPSTGEITAYPKPLSVLSPGGTRPKHLVSPEDLGLRTAPPHPVLSALLVLERKAPDEQRAGVLASTIVDRLPLPQALAALVPQTSSLAALPGGLRTLCSTIERVGGVHRIRYWATEELRPVVRALLAEQGPDGRGDRSVPATDAWEHFDVPVPEVVPEPTRAADSVVRTPVDDAVVIDGRYLALLCGERFAVVQGLGWAIWEQAAEPVTRDALVDSIARDPEAPDDAASRVQAAVDTLLDQGVLTPVG